MFSREDSEKMKHYITRGSLAMIQSLSNNQDCLGDIETVTKEGIRLSNLIESHTEDIPKESVEGDSDG